MIVEIFTESGLVYYYEALLRFPHVDDVNPTCKWPSWTALHRNGFCNKRKNTPAWRRLILTLEQEGLLVIDRKKKVKRLFK